MVAIWIGSLEEVSREPGNVRFGSQADICSAIGHARFTPNSDRKSGHQQNVMSALPAKADTSGALAHVCFEPIADMGTYSIASSARTRRWWAR
jgi:hypothetical protein